MAPGVDVLMHYSPNMSNQPVSTEPIEQLRRLTQPSEQERLQTDAELLALYTQGGDQRAIEALIRRYAGLVASVCRLTVSDPASAEDAFQATFLILLKSAKKIQRTSSVAAWLHGVAYRTACRMRANNRRQLSNRSSVDVNPSSDEPADPLVELARQMELEALDRELQKLPDRLREPLIEHYLLGYTAPEIAQRMELSVSAVEGRLRRGRRTLRTILARRGISLSVVLAGAAWFEKHVQAAEAADWTTRLLDTHFPSGETASAVSSNPEVSSLVRGEMTMLSSGTIKVAVAGCVVLFVGTLAVFSGSAAGQSGDGSGIAAAATNPPPAVFQAEALPEDRAPFTGQMVMGQMIGAGQLGVGRSAGEQAATPPTPAEPLRSPAPPVVWEPPAEGADTPTWLAGGSASMQALEKNRSMLAKTIPGVNFRETPLSQVIQLLSKMADAEIYLDEAGINAELGLTPDEPITLVSTEASLREILRRVGQNLGLSYLVTESGIVVTTIDIAESVGSMRFYDLSYILPNSANIAAVVQAIEQTIHPDSWMSTGTGTSSISIVGSMMIVNAPDITHQHIEVMLVNLSLMNPKNAAQPVEPFGLGGSLGRQLMGGMGGGMGGMGGGGMF